MGAGIDHGFQEPYEVGVYRNHVREHVPHAPPRVARAPVHGLIVDARDRRQQRVPIGYQLSLKLSVLLCQRSPSWLRQGLPAAIADYSRSLKGESAIRPSYLLKVPPALPVGDCFLVALNLP